MFGMSQGRLASWAHTGRPLASFLVFLLLALASPPLNSQISDSSQDRGSIAGTVVDAITQQPLTGTEVTLHGPMGAQQASEQSTSTDGEGRYVFNNLLPGRYVIDASHRGYVLRDHAGPGGFRSRWRALLSGQQIDDLVVALLPGAVIAGHVANEQGQPLPGASIHAMRVSYPRGTRELEDVAQTSTSLAGEYRFTGLTPGNYFLRAAYTPKLEARPGSSRLAYVPICYPGTIDFSACLPLALRAGEEAAGIDLHFVLRPNVHLAGRVIDARTSLPSANAQLSLLIDLSGTPVFLRDASADAAGHFQFPDLSPGTYTLVAQQKGASKPTSAWAVKSVTVSDRNIEDLKLELAPGAEVKGRIRIEGNSGPALATTVATLEPTTSSALATLLPPVQEANISSDGSFAFHDVADGNYWINAFPVPQGFYLKAADSDVLDNGASISGGVGPHVELVLSPGVAKIEGVVVTNDQSCSGIPVFLVPEGKRRAQVRDSRQSVSDHSCRFALRSVPPGDYKIFAWKDRGALMDPDLLRQSEDQAKSVRLKEGADLNVQVEAVSAGEPLP